MVKKEKKKQFKPYRHYGLFQENKDKYVYFLDQTMEEEVEGPKHYKLYYNIVEWFWQNAEVVYATDDIKHPKPMKVSAKAKKLLNVIDVPEYPYYDIDCFLTNGEIEFLDHDSNLQLQMLPERAKLLKKYLQDKGWPEKAIFCPEECPAFLKRKEDEDVVVVLGSLLEWQSYSPKDKELVINKFKEKSFQYFDRSDQMKVRYDERCDGFKATGVIEPGNFKNLKPWSQ